MGRLLSLDVGERRIGVAVCDVQGWMARPLTIIDRRSRLEDFATVEGLVQEVGAEAVIVGYPLNMDGTVGQQARRVARYAAALEGHLSVPLVLWDERLSSDEAGHRLQEGRGSRRVRRHLDDAAAAVILQDYLDAHRTRATGETSWN